MRTAAIINAYRLCTQRQETGNVTFEMRESADEPEMNQQRNKPDYLREENRKLLKSIGLAGYWPI